MNTSRASSLTLLVVAATIFGAVLPVVCASVDSVSVILIDGDMREDWPDRGVVAFHRQYSDGPLTVNFTLGGSAQNGIDFTTTAGTTITIPAGDNEAWLEFTPTGTTMSSPFQTIIVTLAPGPNYEITTVNGRASATVTIGNPSVNPSAKAAVRFLDQAAFGPNANFANVKEVMAKGYDLWITDQFARPIGLQQPYLEALKRARKGKIYGDSKVLSWWRRAMSTASNADPLRQRVGFALSEIFVISDHLDTLDEQPIGMMNYYDMLLKGAFGNFRTLLYNVGTHPCMGTYLNHLGNEKGDPDAGTFADENFAREIMQLFSVGLVDLNLDGTPKLNNGQLIQSYDNATIADMAKVMTGFSFGGPKGDDFYYSPDNFTAPMRMWDAFHDITPKTLIGGITLPTRVASDPDTGAAGLADYNAAIDALFNHPNCPPFICKQLIQKLVTSNPTSAYVARVAAKFVDNGIGVRGDLKAVIRTILLDPEARDPLISALVASGKMKEPYLRTINLARAFNAHAANGVFGVSYLDEIHFQQPLSAPSVFNFFKPGYAPAGPLSDAGLVAPEFQILNAVTATAVPNYYFEALNGNGFNRWGGNSRTLVKPNFANELKLINDVPALMRRLDLLLTGGTLPNEQHQVIREAVEAITPDMWEWKLERVRMAIYLISTSPEFGILR